MMANLRPAAVGMSSFCLIPGLDETSDLCAHARLDGLIHIPMFTEIRLYSYSVDILTPPPCAHHLPHGVNAYCTWSSSWYVYGFMESGKLQIRGVVLLGLAINDSTGEGCWQTKFLSCINSRQAPFYKLSVNTDWILLSPRCPELIPNRQLVKLMAMASLGHWQLGKLNSKTQLSVSTHTPCQFLELTCCIFPGLLDILAAENGTI